MRDRWTPSLAFLIALALHLLVLGVATRQYMASADSHSRVNQAAQRLSTVNGRPVQFIYVKDMVPSKEPPMDPTRLSDVNRRGASPDPRKGTSPDPTSLGGSPIRQAGGPGDAPVTRPSSPFSPASPPPIPARPASPPRQQVDPRQARQAQQERPSPGQSDRPSTNAAAKTNGAGQSPTPPGKAAEAQEGLPVGGEGTAMASPSKASPPMQAQPGREGLGTQLQNMMLGSMQGGYHNPNASRLNAGALSFDTAAWDLGPYARKVQERVQSNWHVPEAQMVLRQQGWVAIRFNILKDGRVTDLQVVRPSGIPSYDQSAMDALRSSDPLPPLPAEVTVPQISGVFRFYYNMAEGEP